jgi:hypothetical protein
MAPAIIRALPDQSGEIVVTATSQGMTEANVALRLTEGDSARERNGQ